MVACLIVLFFVSVFIQPDALFGTEDDKVVCEELEVKPPEHGIVDKNELLLAFEKEFGRVNDVLASASAEEIVELKALLNNQKSINEWYADAEKKGYKVIEILSNSDEEDIPEIQRLLGGQREDSSAATSPSKQDVSCALQEEFHYLIPFLELAPFLREYAPENEVVKKIAVMQDIMIDLFKDQSILSRCRGIRVGFLDHLKLLLEGSFNIHSQRKFYESLCTLHNITGVQRFSRPEPYFLQSLHNWRLLGIMGEFVKLVPTVFSWKIRVKEVLKKCFVMVSEITQDKVLLSSLNALISQLRLDVEKGVLAQRLSDDLLLKWIELVIEPSFLSNGSNVSVVSDKLVVQFMLQYGLYKLPIFSQTMMGVLCENDPMAEYFIRKSSLLKKLRFLYDEILIKNLVSSVLYDIVLTHDNSAKRLVLGHSVGFVGNVLAFEVGHTFVSKLATIFKIPADQMFKYMDLCTLGFLNYPALKQMLFVTMASPSLPYNPYGFADALMLQDSRYAESLVFNNNKFLLDACFRRQSGVVVARPLEEQLKILAKYFLTKGLVKVSLTAFLSGYSCSAARVLHKTVDCTVFSLLPKKKVDALKNCVHGITKILAMQYVFNVKPGPRSCDLCIQRLSDKSNVEPGLAQGLRFLAYTLGDERMLYQAVDEQTLNNIFAEHFSSLIAKQYAFDTNSSIWQSNVQTTGRLGMFCKGLWFCGKTIKYSAFASVFYVYGQFLIYCKAAQNIVAVHNDTSLSREEKKLKVEHDLKLLALTDDEFRFMTAHFSMTQNDFMPDARLLFSAAAYLN